MGGSQIYKADASVVQVWRGGGRMGTGGRKGGRGASVVRVRQRGGGTQGGRGRVRQIYKADASVVQVRRGGGQHGVGGRWVGCCTSCKGFRTLCTV